MLGGLVLHQHPCFKTKKDFAVLSKKLEKTLAFLMDLW